MLSILQHQRSSPATSPVFNSLRKCAERNSPPLLSHHLTKHTPMRSRDYVFTIPLQTLGSPNVPQLEWDPITMHVDHRAQTISLLFGNDEAARYARHGTAQAYPAESKMALVTWALREDPHWFGARIPGDAKAIEAVKPGSSLDRALVLP